MSTKRKHEESEPQSNVHSSRQFLVPANKPAKKKPRRFEPAQLKVQAHASSVNAIKKRIRDVRRRLERADDLPANVRDEDERALAAYEQELAAADAEKTRQKMIKKYHMVRFFGMHNPSSILDGNMLTLPRTAEGHSSIEGAPQAFVRDRIHRRS
jgi:rRNA-processing protein Efg1